METQGMEIQETGNGFARAISRRRRSRSGQRLGYEAQVEVIRRQIGGLEEVRQKLGLSSRKMCQLLLVDPSAWTRWTRPGADAPPHIWRALQWQVSLLDKIPGLQPSYFLNRTEVRVDEEVSRELKDRFEEMQKKTLETQSNMVHEVTRLKRGVALLSGALVLMALLCIFLLVKVANLSI